MSCSVVPLSIVLLVSVQSQTVIPTTNNGTTEVYDTSSSSEFSNLAIVCTTQNCHIVCDEISSCLYTTIDASLSDSLTLQCTNINACYQIRLTNPPKLSANIYCGDGEHTCRNET